MIKELTEKYGFNEKKYDVESYYYWEIEGTIRQGSAIRIERRFGGKLKIEAADEITLTKSPLMSYVLQYHGWQPIELKDLKERLKYLKNSYNNALLKYKMYIMEDKMNKIEKDF